MDKCPTCGNATISLWSKFNASSTVPASCRTCGGMAMLPDHVTTIAGMSFDVLFWGSFAVAVWLRSAWALLLFPAMMAGWAFYVSRFVPLLPISRQQVSASRRSAFRFIAIGAFVVLGAYLLFGRQ